MRVLVVEDDDVLQDAIARTLRADGHAVKSATDLSTARECVAAGIDLIVLDLLLPDGFGLELCREMRQAASNIPILILSALTQVATRVEGLDAGADDFLPKPFAVAELRARVRALGRRGRGARGLVISLDDVVIDFDGRSATKGGRAVSMTAREWTILEFLARRSGRVVPHADLMIGVWGEVTEEFADTLTVLIGRVRRKLGAQVVRTLWGEGYALGDGSKRVP